MKLLTSFIALSLFLPFCYAGELDLLSKKFVSAMTTGDTKTLKEMYLESTTLENTLKEFSLTLPAIKEGKTSVSHVSRELIIGNHAVTLIKMKFDDHQKSQYKQLIYVKSNGVWKVFPWSNSTDLQTLFEQISPEEQIHLKLFNDWARLTEEQLRIQNTQ